MTSKTYGHDSHRKMASRTIFKTFAIAPLVASLLFAHVVALGFSEPARADADATHEFLMSCTYGALAGTLVGTAALAFTDQPGNNLNMIARGASLGLYAGILLGSYVIYAGEEEEERAASQVFHAPRALVAPILGFHGLEGATLQVSLVSF